MRQARLSGKTSSKKTAASALLVCVALACVLLSGCARTSQTITDKWPAPPPEQRLILSPGDTVEVKFRFNPELNELQTIRPDGKISMQLLDEVEVAGLSPTDVDQKLTKLYESTLLKPELTVFVRNSTKMRVFVGGEVKKPGAYALAGHMSALEAVIEAGGFDFPTARASSTIVIRHADGKRYARLVNLREPWKIPVTDAFYLAPNDIVFVPRTTITKVDQFVDQYINQVIPNIVNDIATGWAASQFDSGDNGD